MNVLELPPPKPLFDIPPELFEAIEVQLEFDDPIAQEVPFLDRDISDFFIGVPNRDLWDALYEYAKFISTSYTEHPIFEALVQARKLTADPGSKYVARNNTKGWHVDPGYSIAATDNVPTEYLTGYVDKEKAAKRVGTAMLVDAAPGTPTHLDQVALLNCYENLEEIPGELTIVSFNPSQAILHTARNAHRRPPNNPNADPATRTFVNVVPLNWLSS